MAGSGSNALTITGSLFEVQADLTTLQYENLTAGTDTIVINAANGLGGTFSAAIAVTIDLSFPVVAITSAGGLTNTPSQTLSGTVNAANGGSTVKIFDGCPDRDRDIGRERHLVGAGYACGRRRPRHHRNRYRRCRRNRIGFRDLPAGNHAAYPHPHREPDPPGHQPGRRGRHLRDDRDRCGGRHRSGGFHRERHAGSLGQTFALGVNSITASATDAAGNTASETFTITVVDTPATVTNVVASPSSGDLNTGATATLTLTLSKAVTVTGVPTLSLNDGVPQLIRVGRGRTRWCSPIRSGTPRTPPRSRLPAIMSTVRRLRSPMWPAAKPISPAPM